MCRGGRGSRGTRQLKDFMACEAGDHVNRRHRSASDEPSDRHETVDHTDHEDAARHQSARGSSGRRGQGRRGASGRASYDEMRQQQQQRDIVTNDTKKPWYSSARGRGLIIDHGPPQQPDYTSHRNERHDGPRDVGSHRPDTRRGPGKQSGGGGYRQRYDNRQPAGAGSEQSDEDWNEEVDIARSSGKPVEPQFRAAPVQPAESKMSELRQSYSEQRVSDSVRFHRQEAGRHVPPEPARRIHPTRTYSNRNYQAAENIPNRDRSSQIGGIVDAMNAISVKTAADDEAQRSMAPKSTIIVSGMLCRPIAM